MSLPHTSSRYGELGPWATEICWQVWGTPAHFNWFHILAVLLHGTVVVGISQTLRHWTEGATYVWQAIITLGIGHILVKKLIAVIVGVKCGLL